MTAMCQVVEFTRQKVSVGSWHVGKYEATGKSSHPKKGPEIGRKALELGVQTN